MKFTAVVVLLFASSQSVASFSVGISTFHHSALAQQVARHEEQRQFSLRMASMEDGEENVPKKSRIEGNQREPSARDIEVMDEMITKLSNAKPYELPNAVRRAFRVISSPRFFLRVAERTDMADGEEKEKLTAFASNLVAVVEAVVETTEEQLDERAKEVEDVVKAAAEPKTGEFLVPLLPPQVEAMRKKVEAMEPSSLDEGFLSTIDAWMMKSHEDGMDGMVGILQKVLQMYSGVQIARARERLYSGEGEATSAAKLFDKLLTVDTDMWDAEIRKAIKADEVAPKSLISEIQKTMESVVLGLENGSMAQRVQAEYLRELVTRTESMQK